MRAGDAAPAEAAASLHCHRTGAAAGRDSGAGNVGRAAAVIAVNGDSGEAVTKMLNGYWRAFCGGHAEGRYGSSEESTAQEA